ncbi:hypothetical protein Bbelb_425450 [Branchiostoma belcheri]|nr:hypothetical protein Bbelb_425450 [Branchiostoma belcheri]
MAEGTSPVDLLYSSLGEMIKTPGFALQGATTQNTVDMTQTGQTTVETSQGIVKTTQTPELAMQDLLKATTHLTNIVTECCSAVERLGERVTSLETPSGSDTNTVRKKLFPTESKSLRKSTWKIGDSKGKPAMTNRKEFKITGQVGQLRFQSLTYQIKSGLRQGYTEEEVVDAVIRAIPAGSPLRTYLEGKEQLNLTLVEQVIRAHGLEETATDLYRKLSIGCQEEGESSQGFVTRMMGLRDKVIAASQEEEELYDGKLVQSIDDNIRLRMQPYLDNKNNTGDVELLEEISRAVVDQKERDEKLASTSSPQQAHGATNVHNRGWRCAVIASDVVEATTSLGGAEHQTRTRETLQGHPKGTRGRPKQLTTMDDQPVLALWDTGAQVSIMTDTWREKNLPEIKVRPVIEILEDTASLNLQAANGTEIPYSGWVEVSFKLSEDDSPAISVSFLTTNSPSQDHPIIGYNVIEEIQKRCGSDSALLSRALPVRPQRAAALVNLTEEFSVPNPAGVRVGRKRVRLPRGATVQVMCRIPRGSVEEKQIMLFEPDEAGDWPTGLEVGPALIPVNSTGMIKVPVTNSN